MDNVTHTLVGITLGRTAISKRPPEYQKAALWTGVIGSNLPDIDFLLPFFMGGGKLNYLLHHRGYTHTMLLLIPLAAFAAWIGAKIGRVNVRQWPSLLFLGVIAVALHTTADFCNDYGVHPFSPVSENWFYGGILSIIEPAIWLAILPFAFLESRTKWARYLAGIVGLIMFGLIWLGPFTPMSISIALSFWAGAFILFQKKMRGVWPSYIGITLVLAAFSMGSHFAQSRIQAWIHENSPNENVLQLATTPAPGNPFCWRIVVASEHPSTDRYVARLGAISLADQWFNPATCFKRLTNERTAKLQPSLSAPENHIFWVGQFQSSLSDLQTLYKNDCRFASFLKFVRIPYWEKRGDFLMVGDLRYDYEPGLSFAELEISPDQPCPRFVPPWNSPLSILRN